MAEPPRLRRIMPYVGGGILLLAAAVEIGFRLSRAKRGETGASAVGSETQSRGPTRPDDLEGWGVRWRVAVLAAGGVYLFIAAAIAGAYVFYEHVGAPTVTVRSAERFRAPVLNARLDRDPDWSFAPPRQQVREPDPQVRAAMIELATHGDAGRTP